jgi:hypothetical protein
MVPPVAERSLKLSYGASGLSPANENALRSGNQMRPMTAPAYQTQKTKT